MKTFPNIFNYITGVFPNVTAKAASGLGAKDGTEWKTTTVDNFLFGWVQAVLSKVGQTPNDVAESYNNSQIFNAMREAFSTPESQTVSASGPITLGLTNHKIELDCSLGNISPILPTPDFIGQTLEFFTTGSGIADITGTGLYVNKVFQTSNTGILRITAISATDWKAENVVSADYVSGLFNIIRTASGKNYIYYKTALLSTTTLFNTPVHISSPATVIIYPIAFSIIDNTFVSGETVAGLSWGTFSNPSLTGISLTLIGATNTSTGYVTVKTAGDY